MIMKTWKTDPVFSVEMKPADSVRGQEGRLKPNKHISF